MNGMKRMMKVLPYLILLLALSLLYRELSDLRWDDLARTITSYSWSALFSAVLLVLANFIIWIGYDFISLRQMGNHVPFVRIFRTTSVAFPVTNLVGYSLITGFAIRNAEYSRHGISAGRITQLILFNIESWWAGFLFLFGVYILHSPLSVASSRGFGLVALAGVAIYLLGCALASGRVLRIRRASIYLPDLLSGSMKLLVAIADNTVVSLTMYMLLPPAMELGYSQFAAIYFSALMAGMVSMVPGGLGVFDGILLLLLRPFASDAAILASLILYRLIHFLLPVLIALLIEITSQLRRRPCVVGRQI